MKTIEKTRDITLFAPCNSALEIQMIQNLKRDKAKFLEIIKMHVVVDNKLYVDTVKKQNEHKVSFTIFFLLIKFQYSGWFFI